MANETFKAGDRIITDADLEEIFQKMNEEIQLGMQQYQLEYRQNQMYESRFQRWTVKDFSGTLKFDVRFYDDNVLKYDNYNSFIGTFNNRLNEIKSIYVYFNLSYQEKTPDTQVEFINQHMHLDITEKRFQVDVYKRTNDPRMQEVFDLVMNKIRTAPTKYDNIIKKKSSILFKVGLALGLIPAIILCTIALFFPNIRELFSSSYVLYPICCIILGIIIGTTVCNNSLDDAYANIIKDKKYDHYDIDKRKEVYKDDIESFKNSSEVIIGKNVDNLKYRKDIEEKSKKYPKLIPFELGIILILSIIVIIL